MSQISFSAKESSAEYNFPPCFTESIIQFLVVDNAKQYFVQYTGLFKEL